MSKVFYKNLVIWISVTKSPWLELYRTAELAIGLDVSERNEHENGKINKSPFFLFKESERPCYAARHAKGRTIGDRRLREKSLLLPITENERTKKKRDRREKNRANSSGVVSGTREGWRRRRRDGRGESGRLAVGPGMIPAVSIYTRARDADAHNLLAVCSGSVYNGTHVIVLHAFPILCSSWLAGWLATFLSLSLSLSFSFSLLLFKPNSTTLQRTPD